MFIFHLETLKVENKNKTETYCCLFYNGIHKKIFRMLVLTKNYNQPLSNTDKTVITNKKRS